MTNIHFVNPYPHFQFNPYLYPAVASYLHKPYLAHHHTQNDTVNHRY